jgi:hypothetical protein
MKGVPHVMPLYQVRGKDLIMGFPGVVRVGIALPFDQVLEFAPSAMITMV